MSLTVDELAKEIGRVDGGQCLGDRELAELLLPFIERHIAAGQTPKPAGNAIDGLLATARPFLAEELLLKQGYTWSGSGWVAPDAKPAGAVPLPDRDAGGRIVREAWVRWALTQPNPKPSWLVPYDELSEPDKEADRQIFEACAREAAGRAGAVPASDHIRRQVGKIDKYRLCTSHNESYFGEPAGLLKSVVTELARAVDPIYPEPTPEVDPLAGVVVYTETGTHTAPFAPIPQRPEAEGDDIAVDRFADAMKGKMAAARAKGRGGWEGPTCNADILSRMLRDHVEKGDPRDVANFCMMLWNRGEAIQASPTPAADAGGVIVTDEVVNRAYQAFHSGRHANTFEAWRAALTAALTPEVRHGEPR